MSMYQKWPLSFVWFGFLVPDEDNLADTDIVLLGDLVLTLLFPVQLRLVVLHPQLELVLGELGVGDVLRISGDEVSPGDDFFGGDTAVSDTIIHPLGHHRDVLLSQDLLCGSVLEDLLLALLDSILCYGILVRIVWRADLEGDVEAVED